jgi:hypothetical protein
MSAAFAAEDDAAYVKLKQAIKSGKDIRMTLDLSACQVYGTDKPGPSVGGSLRFEGYMIEDNQKIAFATTHFTMRPDNTPVDEFLSFEVEPNGKVAARTRFLNPLTYAVLHDSQFDCALGRGIDFHW